MKIKHQTSADYSMTFISA